MRIEIEPICHFTKEGDGGAREMVGARLQAAVEFR